MKCLILGGGGFLGWHLTGALLDEGHTVRIFERPNSRRPDDIRITGEVEWVEGDFANKADVAAAVQDREIIFHFISTTLPKSSNDNPIFDVETNVVGTLNLLELMRKGEGGKLIFPSSGGTVYGIPQVIPLKESHPTNPLCSYGITKLAIEKYLHLYHQIYGLDYRILRLSNPYGEKQNMEQPQGAIGVFLNGALCGKPIEIWGDGTVVRDYLYVGDAIDAFMKVASYRGDCRLFNIGAGYGKSLNDVLVAIELLLGRPVRRGYLPSRTLDVPVNVLDISKAIDQLGWQPKTTFEEGLLRTYSWLLQKGSHATSGPRKA